MAHLENRKLILNIPDLAHLVPISSNLKTSLTTLMGNIMFEVPPLSAIVLSKQSQFLIREKKNMDWFWSCFTSHGKKWVTGNGILARTFIVPTFKSEQVKSFKCFDFLIHQSDHRRRTCSALVGDIPRIN